MRQSYQEGSFFAVPLLDGGYGAGLVARLSPGSKIMLAYLFGPRQDGLPDLAQLASLTAQDAVKVLRVGDMALVSGHWRVLGELSALAAPPLQGALSETEAAAHVGDVQVRQRRELVAVADLEAEVAQAEVVERVRHAPRFAVRRQFPALQRVRVEGDGFHLDPQFLLRAAGASGGCPGTDCRRR